MKDILDTKYIPNKQNGETEGLDPGRTDTPEYSTSKQEKMVVQDDDTTQRVINKYLTLFNNMEQGFCIIEMIFDEAGNPVDYRFLETNPVFVKQTGLKDAVGKTIKELISNHEEYWFRIYGDVAKTGKSVHFENEAANLAGGVFYEVFAIRIDNPDEGHVAVLFNDITGRKRREHNLTFLAHMAEVISSLSTAGQIMQAIGLNIRSYLKVATCSFISIDDDICEATVDYTWNSLEVPSLLKTFRIKDYVDNEFISAGKSGELITICNTQNNLQVNAKAFEELSIGSLVLAPFLRKGKWLYCLSITDTSPRKWQNYELDLVRDLANMIFPRIEKARTEEALRESEEKFSVMFQSMPIGISLTSFEDGIIYDVNKAGLDFTGVSGKEEVIGKSISGLNVIEQEKRNYLKEQLKQHGFVRDAELKFTSFTNKGHIVSLNLDTVSLKGKRYILTTSMDITERKKLEETLQQQNIELQKARDKAEESDRFKTAFIANISHEIRTPMSGILGFADLLKVPDLSSESQNMYIEAIITSGKRMLSIINDLINISKIETGQIELKKEVADINKLMDELYIFFLPEANKKGIVLKVNKELAHDKFLVETDKTKVYQIISNLIKNSLKYTLKGYVEFGYTIKDNFCLFNVTDTGPGIKEEYHKLIFDGFKQGEAPHSGIQEGVGLGLAITKAYVQALGGNIWLKSAPSEGSTFYFTIPFKEPKIMNTTIKNKENNPDKQLLDMKILIAEDEEFIYFFLNEVLKLNNYNTIHARNGHEAINAVNSNPDIKLILMDGRMPVMNGLEATRQIKKIRPDIPIIALSAMALDSDIEEALGAGCNDYLTKPIEVKALLDKISSCLVTTKP
jgi:PAS domain S-box-containing protein